VATSETTTIVALNRSSNQLDDKQLAQLAQNLESTVPLLFIHSVVVSTWWAGVPGSRWLTLIPDQHSSLHIPC